QKGSFSEKMAVPSFGAKGTGDELGMSARSYLRQVEAWSKVTRTDPTQQALLLYQNLSGRAWVESEELNVDDLASSQGLKIFKSWIRERYQEVEVSRIAEALTLFFKKMKRQTGQSIREFNSVFDRGHSRLLEIDCRLPEVARAWAYLNALGLSNSEELSLLASVGNDYSTAKLQKAAILHEKSLRGPWVPRNKGDGKGAKSAFLTGTDNDEPQHGIDDDRDDDETGACLPEEAAIEIHEAFVAQESAKARYRDIVKARGVDPENIKHNKKNAEESTKTTPDDSLAQAKLRSYCAGCGRRGHWHKDAECPLNRSGNQAPASKPRAPQDHQVHATTVSSGAPASIVEVAYMVGDLGGDRLLAITDTACSKSVMGQKWLESYLRLAKEIGVDTQFLDCHDDFRFGASRLFHANFSATIVIQIRDRVFMLRASVVQGEVPLLMSRSALSKLGMVYDLEGHAAQFKHLGIERFSLMTTDSGHPAIPVTPKRVPGMKWPSPQEWASSEVIIVPSAGSQYTTFMTSASDAKGDVITLPPYLMASSNPPLNIWKMNKTQLMSEAVRLNLTVHSSWSVGEIRQILSDHRRTSDQESSVPRGLASMTLEQLKTQASALQIPIPPRATKGQLQLLIRDATTREKAEAIVTFGRHKNKLYKEVPTQYLEWAMMEVRERGAESSGPDLVSLANYAKAKLQPEETESYNPEVNSKVPLPPESSADSCWESHWSELTETALQLNTRVNNQRKGNEAQGYQRQPTPKKRSTATGSHTGEKQAMEQEVPPEVRKEIETLMSRLAALKDRHGL
ncbi:GIP, partial [Symbiodinium sp. KB8]